MGLAGAWYVADFYRLGVLGEAENERGVLSFAIPVAAASVGLILSIKSVERSRWLSLFAGLASLLAAGALIGAVVGSNRTTYADAALLGAVTSLAFAPAVVLITWLARIAGRARPGSLLDGADRRAPWAATAVFIAAGRIANSRDLIPTQFTSPFELRATSMAIGLLACVVLVVILAFDLVSLKRARAALFAESEMTPRDPFEGLPCDDVIDVGIGNEEHEEVFGGPAYRSVAKPLRVLKGSPTLAIPPLRVAVLRATLLLIVALGVTLITIVSKSHDTYPAWRKIYY
jgi:hypothetical protein